MYKTEIYKTRQEILDEMGFKDLCLINSGYFKCKAPGPQKGIKREYVSYSSEYGGQTVHIMILDVMSHPKDLAPILKMYEVLLKQREFLLLRRK